MSQYEAGPNDGGDGDRVVYENAGPDDGGDKDKLANERAGDYTSHYTSPEDRDPLPPRSK